MHAFVWLLLFVAVLWVVGIVDALAGLELGAYGIVPRTADGLRGIPLHVFLHGGFTHLLSNSGPLIVLGGLVSLRGSRTLLTSSVFIVLVGGLAVWLAARPSVHIGASGLVFGYFGYLVARGFYERSFKAILIAVVVAFFYWGLIFGVLPQLGFVSWEGHLFGLIAGVLYAYIVRRDRVDGR